MLLFMPLVIAAAMCQPSMAVMPAQVVKLSIAESVAPSCANAQEPLGNCMPQLKVLHQNVKCWGKQVEAWVCESSLDFDLICLCEHHLHPSLVPYASKRMRRAGWDGNWEAASSTSFWEGALPHLCYLLCTRWG